MPEERFVAWAESGNEETSSTTSQCIELMQTNMLIEGKSKVGKSKTILSIVICMFTILRSQVKAMTVWVKFFSKVP